MEPQIEPIQPVQIEQPPKSPITFPMIIFLVLFLSAGLLSFIFAPQKEVSQAVVVDEMRDWKTYRNEEYGFEFKYPVSSVINFSPEGDFGGRLFALEVISKDGTVESQIMVTVNSPAEIFLNYRENGVFQIVNEESININGYVWKVLDFTPIDPYSTDLGTDYRIAGYESNFTFYLHTSGNKEIFDRILSTFKFVDSPDEMSDWKTYRNEEYGFEFKYPNNYVAEVINDDKYGYYVRVFDSTAYAEFLERKDVTDQEFPVIYITPNASLDFLRGGLAFGVNLSFSFTEEYFKNDSWQTYLGKITVDSKNGFQFRHCEFNDHVYTIFQNSQESFFVIETLNTDNLSYCDKNVNTTNIEPYNTIVSTFKFAN